uniref:Uncharacterized protein n=1 Tax=Arundo donax TaxID=35708 RepID=A0A0A9DNW1_ARUDO
MSVKMINNLRSQETRTDHGRAKATNESSRPSVRFNDLPLVCSTFVFLVPTFPVAIQRWDFSVLWADPSSMGAIPFLQDVLYKIVSKLPPNFFFLQELVFCQEMHVVRVPQVNI